MYLPEEITPEVAEASSRIQSLHKKLVSSQDDVNEAITAYNRDSEKMSEEDRHNNIQAIIALRENALQQRENFNKEYISFKASTNLPFNPYPAEYHSPENIDDDVSIPTYAYLAPNPAWDGVGCAVLNGPSSFDETMRSIGESLQAILTLPSGYIHKRVGSIHEPIGGMKEMEVSYKYDDFRRTTLDLNPAFKYLLPHQIDEILYKDWKMRGEKLFKYVPLNNGPQTMEEIRREFMEGGATMHSKALMNVFDPIATLPARKATKLIRDPAHEKQMENMVRNYRTQNEDMFNALAQTSSPLEKEKKRVGLEDTII